MTTGEPADLDSEWLRKGATLSDKTARKEFGLTQNEIVQGIRTGKLQCRRCQPIPLRRSRPYPPVLDETAREPRRC
jgi:hypothetical protein